MTNDDAHEEATSVGLKSSAEFMLIYRHVCYIAGCRWDVVVCWDYYLF